MFGSRFFSARFWRSRFWNALVSPFTPIDVQYRAIDTIDLQYRSGA